jgi:hypothetical protein
MQTKFDIFVQPPHGKSCWITATTSFEEAEKRVDQLSRCLRGALFDLLGKGRRHCRADCSLEI